MDTEGMQPHPIFDALQLVTDEMNRAFARRHQAPTVGWDHAFADMEEDSQKEEAFAVSLGFESASAYHAASKVHYYPDGTPDVPPSVFWEATQKERDQFEGLMVDWYEREDLRP